MANKPRRLSFDIDSARDHLDKMIRDSERLEATDNRIEKSDHAINAAWTGWHLHEWVWAEVKEIERSDPPTADHLDADTKEQIRLHLQAQKRKFAELRVEIGKELNVNPSAVGKEEFGVFMAKRHPSIEMCRVIAAGSKHLDVDSTGVEIETYVSAAVPEVASSKETGGMNPVEVVFTGVPKIRYDGLVYGSSDVFREAQQVWTDFIYGNKIDK